MKKIIVALIFALTIFGAFTPLIPAPAHAFSVGETGLQETAEEADLPETDIPTIVGRIVRGVLALVGVIFFLLLVYGGLLWMTARGNQENVTKAKELIIAAVIGLLIVLAAYAISQFVITVLVGGNPITPETPVE